MGPVPAYLVWLISVIALFIGIVKIVKDSKNKKRPVVGALIVLIALVLNFICGHPQYIARVFNQF